MKTSRRILFSLAAVISSAVLFYLSHPNALFPRGVGPLAFVALVPVLMLVSRGRVRTLWLYGALYGALSYGAFCSWLMYYHPLTIYLVCVLYAVIGAVLFLALRLVLCAAPHGLGLCAAGAAWLCYEYVKTLGFAGFSYGILGYTQWKSRAMLSLASVGGVWLCSVPCVLCSVFAASFALRLSDGIRSHGDGWRKGAALRRLFLPLVIALAVPPVAALTGAAFGALYGGRQAGDSVQTAGVVLVQSNVDPWKGGVDSYSRDLRTLMHLTDEALSLHPDAQIVVWPETAFVPSVAYQYSTRADYSRYQLVLSLLSYVQEHDQCFVIGNQHSVDTGGQYTDDYNAALVLDARETPVIPPVPEVYAKRHLVPFTEWFPYQRAFPRLYRALLQGDTHLWSPGTECTVFRKRGVSFSTPICFEDTFGDGCREFVAGGARLFVNLSNDAWAGSLPDQMQHLSMAVFRSAENRVPSVRSTASGMTCFVSADGTVTSMAEPFREAWLYGEVSVTESGKPTFYTRHGDWLPRLMLLLTVALTASGLILRLLHSRGKIARMAVWQRRRQT